MLDLVEPSQRTVLVLLAEFGEQSTDEIGAAICATPQQVGATLARLRTLKLVHTIRSRGMAYHDLDGWARIGAPMWRAGAP